MLRPSEDDLIARYLAPLAGPGGFGLRDDAAIATPPPRARPRRDEGHAGRRRALLSRRSARRHRPQGAAGEPLRPRRQGGRALRHPARPGTAAGLDRGVARRLRRRPRRRLPPVRLPRARRRHGGHALDRSARPAHPLDHRLRHGAGRPHGAAHRRASGRCHLRQRHDRRRRARSPDPPGPFGGPCLDRGARPPSIATRCSPAISAPSRG